MDSQIFIFGLFLLGLVQATVDQKSSLTFVIDDTGSMQIDVHELKKTAKSVFDKVETYKSHIDDFIVVTFNDPEVEVRNNEHSKSDFETALSDIEARGGGNCAEMSLSGMQLGLEKSRAASLLWVFTDASAADMEKYYKVEELSQKMGSQVYFAVTGLCDNRTNPDFLVYRDLAIATNGQVFHLRKNEIGQIFKYVELLIEDRKDIVTSKTFPAGGLNQIEVNVDDEMDDLIIAVSGENPKVTVSNSSGVLATTDVTRLGEIAVVTVAVARTGVYKVQVTSNSETHVVVSASTTVHFEHGFSVFSSSNIKETTRKPVPGTQSHLSVQLLASDGSDQYDVRSVQILDMDDRVILEEPLELVNKVTQFYTSKKITPPDHMFKVAVKMYDTGLETLITRHGLTPIKPQNKTTGDNTPKAPVVTIDGGPNINAAYYHPLQLRCKINGYPTPSVIWTSSDESANLTYDKHVSIFELPDDYISVLDISEVKNNATYNCTATNVLGTEEATVSVQTQVIIVSTPIELPENATIEYLKAGRIACKVETFPVAKVSWYKNGTPLKPDGNLEVSKDGSVLFIRSMEPYMADSYSCSVENPLLKEVYPFKLTISGLEPPTIKKINPNMTVMKNSPVDLKCPVTAGIPIPSITWFYKDVAASEFTNLNEKTDTMHFDTVNVTNAGTYFCLAENIVGSDSMQYELNVNEKCQMPKEAGPCRAAHSKWYYDSDLKECRTFIFGGCRGNGNNFDTELACRSECVPTPVVVTTQAPIGKCQQPMTEGPCHAALPRWYYDNNLNECRKFSYGGCRGNGNNFNSEAACRSECVPTPVIVTTPSVIVTTPPVIVTTQAPIGKCQQPMTEGPCRAALPRWYYDNNLNECRQFSYGGCRGNGNNFNSETACRSECKISEELAIDTTPEPLGKCQQPMTEGPCRAALPRWYYDNNLNECRQFSYGGCRGNGNNFNSEAACRSECEVSEELAIDTTPAPLGKCEQPMEVGLCQAAFQKWYYDSGLKACRKFIYGGCHGNENNFNSEAACRAECAPTPLAIVTTPAPSDEYDTESDTVEPPTSIGCLLDTKRDLNGNNPLMLTQNDEFTNFETSEGYLEIPVNQTIKLVCPVKFNKLLLKEIIVTCESEKRFIHQPSGRHYEYSELKCTDQWQYKNIKTGRQCLNTDSELLNVGFEIRGRFQEIYQVCLNRITNNPVYVKHNLVQAMPNAVSNKDAPWFDNEDSVDLDVTFDCGTQNEETSRTLNKEFHKDGCCFAKRMLVNPLDVAPGSPQAATYSNLNIAPHWSSCNSQNWEAIEQRIRDLRRKSGRPLQVWTGVAQQLQIADASSELKNITLSQSGKDFHVPKYFWKVVQDTGTKASLAIVQVNIPDLKLGDAHKHVLCPDVCRKTTWMKSGQWRNPARGYTYCCELPKFKSAFQLAYYGILPTSDKLLLDATTLPNLVV